MVQMDAVILNGFGGPEVLTLGKIERPVPAAGQVLIKVAAAGVNRPDVLQRKGGYPPPPGAPETLGLEVAGEVVEANGCKRFKVGDKVTVIIHPKRDGSHGGAFVQATTADGKTLGHADQQITTATPKDSK